MLGVDCGGATAPRPRVLVVDDEPSVRRALARELGADFEVVQAACAREALAALELPGTFAAVVSDLMMPGGSGMELLSQVRERWPACGRVLISGSLMAGDREVLDAGIAEEVLQKPWYLREVEAAVHRLLARPGRRP